MVDAFVKMIGVGVDEIAKVSKQIGVQCEQCEPKVEGAQPTDCENLCESKPLSRGILKKPSPPWGTRSRDLGSRHVPQMARMIPTETFFDQRALSQPAGGGKVVHAGTVLSTNARWSPHAAEGERWLGEADDHIKTPLAAVNERRVKTLSEYDMMVNVRKSNMRQIDALGTVPPDPRI